MVFLKLLFFVSIIPLTIMAQFNQFQYEEEKDSIFTEKESIVLVKPLVGKNNKSRYIKNILFSGYGFENNNVRTVIYKSLDVIFAVGAVASYYQINQSIKDSRSFASEHAGIYPNSDKLAQSMGIVQSLKDIDGSYGYNTLWFKNDSTQNMINEIDENSWVWDSEENLQKYNGKLSDEKKYINRVYLYIGGLLLNRVVSTLDFAISSRKFQVTPEATTKSLGVTVTGDL